MAEATKKPADESALEQAAEEAEAKATATATAAAKPAAGARGRGKPKGRIETFDAVRPDGKTVTIVRNIDTGEQTATVQE